MKAEILTGQELEVEMWQLASLLMFFLLGTPAAYGDSKEYIIRIQEERKSTRFTLEGYLRDRQKMRMMDAWLAMVTEPQSKFSPELAIGYVGTQVRRTSVSPSSTAVSPSVTQGAVVQVWLSNLVSSVVRTRTLNIDLGFEGEHREGNISDPVGSSSNETEYVAGALRLLGKSSQDSSLSVLFGRYKTSQPGSSELVGLMGGARLQLYILRNLGAEGHLSTFGRNGSLKKDGDHFGSQHSYLGFFEISLLRVSFGKFFQEWRLNQKSAPNRVVEDGYVGSVKVLL